MQYNQLQTVSFAVPPVEWDKNSPREILQYAVGGLLYMPATRVQILDEIISNKNPELRSFVLDLEDALGDDLVQEGEQCIKLILKGLYDAQKSGILSIKDIPLIFIRVREPGQMSRICKYLGTRLTGMLTGFALPKFDKTNCDAYLSDFDNAKVFSKSNLYIMPILESRQIMYKQFRIENLIYIYDLLKLRVDDVLNIRVGATDFSNIFGIRRDIHHTVYDVAVVVDCFLDILNVFTRSFVCSAPVWEYFGQTEGLWSDGLKRELIKDRLNGYVGKTCIHPSQLSYISQNYIVPFSEYTDAMTIMGMSQSVQGVVKGYGGNKMNEVKAHGQWAKRTLGLASMYGVYSEISEDSNEL